MRRMTHFLLAALIVGIGFIAWERAGPVASEPTDATESHHNEGNAALPAADVRSGGSRATLPPIARGVGDREAFNILRDCLTYARFSNVMNLAKSDPESPWSNPARLSQLPSGQQRTIRERMDLVARSASSCEAWSKEVDSAEAAALAYTLSLKLGEQGDVEAATCFIIAPWETPQPPSAEAAAFEQRYRANARKLADGAIRKGSWEAVLAAYNATRTPGFQGTIGYSQEEQYQLARLLQHGMSDVGLSESLSYEVARLGAELGASKISESDKVALRLYRSVFKGKAISDEALHENCGN